MKTTHQSHSIVHGTAPQAPSVSIIIPARNAAGTLTETVHSVLRQDRLDWELIIIDDGSTDTTRDMANGLAAQDARITCLRGESRGVSAARNLGARAAHGELLAFLDADDLWMPGKLSAHVRRFDAQPSLGVSFDRILFVDTQGNSTGVESTRRVQGLTPADFLHENPACTASTIVARRVAFQASGGFDESMACSEDLEWLLRMRCCTDWAVEGLPEVFTHYRAAQRGASSQLEAMQKGWEQMVDKVRAYAPELVRSHYRSARAVHLRYLARRCARLGLPATHGLNLFARAWTSSPLALIKEPRRTLGTLAALLLAATPLTTPRRA